MNFILDDIESREDLYPFTLTRSAADIRTGILTPRERWQLIAGKTVRLASEQKVSDEIIIPACINPTQAWLKKWKPAKKNTFSGLVKISYPFHIFQHNDAFLKEDFILITRKRKSKKISSSNIARGKEIFLEPGAVVENSILDSSTGPIYLGKNSRIMDGCIIHGPFALCEGAIVKSGAKIYGATTIGPFSIAGGEIKNSVLFGYSNKSHDGYLGDSVIGEWCNLGAGTSNSNIKNTAGMVRIWNDNKKEFIPAGLKCGLMMGDYSRCAINTSFNTGTVVGVACNIFGTGPMPVFIDSFTWGNETYELEKALEHINNWKKLKGLSITEKEKEILTRIFRSKK